MIVYLDTETTGLSAARGDKIVEISIVDQEGNVLIDTLVNPERYIPSQASNIHNISDSMVLDAPVLEDLLPEINRHVKGRDVVIYNSAYDTMFFPDKLVSSNKIYCAMKEFTSHIGRTRWVKLTEAAKHVGHIWTGKAHRSLADTLATRSVWIWMNPKYDTKIKLCKCGTRLRVPNKTGIKYTCPKCNCVSNA
jgi:DNA polymerase-3 subunit epsilon